MTELPLQGEGLAVERSRMTYRDALTAAVHAEWHAAHKRAGGDGLCVGTAHERTFEDTANALLDPFLAALQAEPSPETVERVDVEP